MNILFVFGTRPEAIKLAPLIFEFGKAGSQHRIEICSTGQHREMLDDVLNFFGISPNYDLNLMKPNQSLHELTSGLLEGIRRVVDKVSPDMVFVQGDTTTAFCAALSAFYEKIPVAHVEAGLRSFDKYSPFPEEMNRLLLSRLATYHFAPTERALENLERERIVSNVYLTGNTVVDALYRGLEIIDSNRRLKEEIEDYFGSVLNDTDSRVILVTAHRRESFGKPFESICRALKKIALEFEGVEVVYPVHLNPNVRGPVFEILGGIRNIHLIEPLSYPYLIWLMRRSYLILTDSGGIQEEAPSLGKPVLVMRNVTERTEGIEAGVSVLVGTDEERIFNETARLLEDKTTYDSMRRAADLYGDGKASERIREIVEKSRK